MLDFVSRLLYRRQNLILDTIYLTLTEREQIIEKKTLEAAASGEIYPTISLYEVMDMLG